MKGFSISRIGLVVSGILLAVVGCTTQQAVAPSLTRSYTLTKLNGSGLPVVLATSANGSSTLKEQSLQLSDDGSYRITYTLVLRSGEKTETQTRMETGRYLVNRNQVILSLSLTHPSALDGNGPGFLSLTGEVNFVPNASGARIGEYVEN